MSIIPAHFLTVPLPQFREALEDIQDIHYVLKITKLGEEFKVEKYPIRASLDSQFCLKTSEMAGSSLCYISSGIPIFGFGAGPACNHSAIKTFYTVHDTRNCPQLSNALELFAVCESRENNFKNKELKPWQQSLDIEWKFNIEPSIHVQYKIETTLGKLKTVHKVSHELLCKYNGILPMGSLPSKYEEINCKNIRNCQIEFVAFEKKESENYKQKFKVVKFFKCDHDNACDGGTSEGQIGKSRINQYNNFNYCHTSHPLSFKKIF